jgi:hypothetical protein
MKEIKFFTHLTRNFYLYFWTYLLLLVLFDYKIDYKLFLFGLFAYAIGYAPVYFINDSQDWREDKDDKKSNLYLSIKNVKLFWLVTALLLIIGVYLGMNVSLQGYVGMLFAYLLNILHTFNPFHFRKKPVLGAVNYFILSIVKFFIILYYLHFSFEIKIIPLMVIFASATTMMLLIYKRHKQGSKFVERFFGLLFLASSIVAVFQYPLLLIFFIPIALILTYLHFRYTNKQVPVNLYQLIFLLYTIFVYGIFIVK